MSNEAAKCLALLEELHRLFLKATDEVEWPRRPREWWYCPACGGECLRQPPTGVFEKQITCEGLKPIRVREVK